MNIIYPKTEILHHGLESEFMTPAKFIELVGRTCYKSEDKITDTSAEKFVGNLIKRGHEAMIEHWTLIFQAATSGIYDLIHQDMNRFTEDTDLDTTGEKPHLRFTHSGSINKQRCIISGNIRAWRDFTRLVYKGYGVIPPYLRGMILDNPVFFPEWQDCVDKHIPAVGLTPITVKDLQGYKEHSVHHDVTVKFITDRGVSHEMVRHREASFAQESTRYCDYASDKHNREIGVIPPVDIRELDGANPVHDVWAHGCEMSESVYSLMRAKGCTPQTARSALSTALKTEVIMTANLGEWDHVFGLRCAPDAHPDIQEVMKWARDEFHALFPDRYYQEA